MAEPEQLTSVNKGIALHDNPRGIAGSEEVHHIYGTVDPSAVGRSAPEGSLFSRTNGEQYTKIGPADTDWQLLAVSALRTISPVVIAPGNTEDIDVIGTTRRFVVYHLLIDQPAAPKLTKITVDMVSDGASPVHSVPSDIGDIQNIETISVLDTGAIRLKITNNEANSITVSGKVLE